MSWKEFKLRLMLRWGRRFYKTSTINHKITIYMNNDFNENRRDICHDICHLDNEEGYSISVERSFDWCNEILGYLYYDELLKNDYCKKNLSDRYDYKYQRMKLTNEIIQVIDTEYALVTAGLTWLPLTILSILLDRIIF